MPKLDSLRLDPAKLEEGTWLEHSSGLRFKARRGSDPNFEEKVILAYRRELGPEASVEEQHTIVRRLFFEDRLTDWGEHLNSEGEEIPFSSENAAKVYEDVGLHYIFDWLFAESTKVTRFRPDTKAELEKNSARSSSGKTTGGTPKPEPTSKPEASVPG